MISLGQIILAVILVIIGFVIGLLVGMYLEGRNKEEDEPMTTPVSPSSMENESKPALVIPVIEQPENPQEPEPSYQAELSQESEPPLAQPSQVPEPVNPTIPETEVKPVESITAVEETKPIEHPSISLTSPAVTKPVAPPPLPKPRAAADKNKSASQSMADQVDEILQDMLSTTSYAGRHIHLVQGVHGGIVVWVGANHYNEIDDVPDPEIIKLIRAAAAEWERRNW